MTSNLRFIMVALAALVAGTLLVVHVWRAAPVTTSLAASNNAQPEGFAASGDRSKTAESAAPGSESDPLPQPKQSAAELEVLYDLNTLPDPIKSMLQSIVVAAQAGNIDEMLPVLQENELPPMLSAEAVSDPIAYWKKHSADGQGRDILAAMLNVFSSGFMKKGDGKSVQYVWPYFAELDLTKLTPAQQVELFRVVPAADAVQMIKTGKYSYYRAGIGNDGVWHYFMK